MKRLVIVLIVLLSSLSATSVWAKDVGNFYFSDFTADYYLSRDNEGVSHLKVVENIVAEFPNYEQNKGIKRLIPFYNQGNKSISLPHFDKSDVRLLRNGIEEPIWNIEREGDHYVLETGTDDYLLGTQKYTIEYEFEKVIIDVPGFQELYWDTNGTGWSQRFDSVTARVHFVGDVADTYTGRAWCFVGEFEADGQSRCDITDTFDGFEFTTKRVGAYENLTYEIEIEPNTFTVPEPDTSYAVVITTVVIGLLCVAIIIVSFIKNKKINEKIGRYKNMIVAPQYQPNPNYQLMEITEVYLGDKKDAKVGALLKMIVDKKVSLRKKEESGLFMNKWELIMNNRAELSEEESLLLQLLSGGSEIVNGESFDLKSHIADTDLVLIGKSLDKKVLDTIKEEGLVSRKYKIGSAGTLSLKGNIISNLTLTFCVVLIAWPMTMFVLGIVSDMMLNFGKITLYDSECNLVLIPIIAIMMFILLRFSDRKTRIEELTDRGLVASNYMEGLKLYIKMAEVDRLKFLQSVEGADTSDEGIVKLYEKLLPYAAVFGLEESWLKEMKQYCELKEISEPDYLLAGITAAELSHSVRSAANYASSSGHTIAGGGSYSSSSGGGGGGFSGGGGGGGGGGGR